MAAWELANEPYTWLNYGLFTNGADYATQMKPFRDAIKVVDSNAVVALFSATPAIKIPIGTIR